MAIGDYLRALRRFWWVIVLTTLIGAGIGYGTVWLSKPQYQSTAQLFVTTQSGTSVGDAYQNNLFSQDRVVSYASLATSLQVAARAVDQLKAPVSADELRTKITATPVEKTVLLNVTATDADPQRAQAYASAVADQLVQVVSELETSRRGGTPAAGAVLVDEASYPTAVVALSLALRIAIGAVAGLLLGLLAAVVAGFLDTRVRGRERIEDAGGSAVIGSLVHDPNRPQVAVTDLEAGGLAAERLRELRTHLQFARLGGADDLPGRRTPQVIAVTSPSRGDGRSSVTVDLAAALAETGRRTVVVDGDLFDPQLADRLPLTASERSRASAVGLSTVLGGDDLVADALVTGMSGLGFDFLPAGPVPAGRKQLWASERAAKTLAALHENYDYVVVDTSALDSCGDAALVAALSDGAVVLARLGATRTATLRRALEALHNAEATVLGAVMVGERHRKSDVRPAAGTPDKPDTTHAAADPTTQTIPAAESPVAPTVDEDAAAAGSHRLTNPGRR